ncbi:MAG: hypothetical protein ACSLFP_13310 [Acidimicrobiales bacterium]
MARRRFGVLGMATMLVVVACGGGDDGGALLGDADNDLVACEVLSAAEVGGVVGTAMGAETMETPSGELDPVGCRYSNESGDLIVLATVRLGEKYYGGMDSPARQDPVAISDLGDDAFVDNGSVGFLSGEWTGLVASIAGGVSDADLEAVARILESQLP